MERAMQRWRIGLIGCGWAGQQHARALRATGNRAELCALADSDTDLATELAKEWRTPVWTADYRELLTRAEIDGVSLCLPHSLHAPVAIQAAQAGKHVMTMAEEAEPIRAVRQELRGYTRVVRIYRKRCPICGTEFEGPKRQIYDRGACASVAWDRAHPESRKARTRRYDAKRYGKSAPGQAPGASKEEVG
jgi:hypothetical protein